MKYIIGIDEAGRGSWAGPVSAGAFCARGDFDFSLLEGLTDSKVLSPKKREILFATVEKLEKEGKCYCAYAESPAGLIDRVGIREANRQAMEISLQILIEKIPLKHIENILIDGRDNYSFAGIPQEKVRYIIKGDLIEPIISAASIIAKVLRDKKMCEFHEEYPFYEFYQHKGYGTRKHETALHTYGITPLHRKSYAPVKALISREA